MKTFTTPAWILGSALMLGFGLSGASWMSAAPPDAANREGAAAKSGRVAKEKIEVNAGPVHVEVGKSAVPSQRASVVIGMSVKNTTGSEIGKVNDLILDLRQGKVLYAAVTFSESLRPENRLSAVPWERFELRQAEDGRPFLVLDVDDTTLSDVPSFDQKDWPNMVDARWSDAIDRFFSRIRSNRRQNAADRRAIDSAPPAESKANR